MSKVAVNQPLPPGRALALSVALASATVLAATQAVGFTAAIAWPSWIGAAAREGTTELWLLGWDLVVVYGVGLLPFLLVSALLLGWLTGQRAAKWGLVTAGLIIAFWMGVAPMLYGGDPFQALFAPWYSLGSAYLTVIALPTFAWAASKLFTHNSKSQPPPSATAAH